MIIASQTVKVSGGNDRILCLRYLGQSASTLSSSDVNTVRHAFQIYIERRTSRRLTENRANLHLSKVKRETLSHLRKWYAELHPWIKDLSVEEIKI